MLFVKRFICWLGFGAWLVEFCDHCGRRPMFAWWAPSKLWSEITGYSLDGEGVRCERCFELEARKKGIVLLWVPRVDCRRSAAGEWQPVAPPDPELFPVAARLHAERSAADA